jgi:hypothetical protein
LLDVVLPGGAMFLVIDDYAGACLRESYCDGASDAATSAGDHCELVGYFHREIIDREPVASKRMVRRMTETSPDAPSYQVVRGITIRRQS